MAMGQPNWTTIYWTYTVRLYGPSYAFFNIYSEGCAYAENTAYAAFHRGLGCQNKVDVNRRESIFCAVNPTLLLMV